MTETVNTFWEWLLLNIEQVNKWQKPPAIIDQWLVNHYPRLGRDSLEFP